MRLILQGNMHFLTIALKFWIDIFWNLLQRYEARRGEAWPGMAFRAATIDLSLQRLFVSHLSPS
jgi:hypothetical protein